MDVVPVLIGRRIPYVTFRLLNPCGVIIHQTYNQLYPASHQELADRARHKKNLGYHDIRTGNEPDHRLSKFMVTDLFSVAATARRNFEKYKDLLDGFSWGELRYPEFAARVRRRQDGVNEDNDRQDADPADWE